MRRVVLLACLALLAGCGGLEPRPTSRADRLRRRVAEDRDHRLRARLRRRHRCARRSRAPTSSPRRSARACKPDVFASANTKLPDELYDEGLVEKPVVFAANELVLAVPADGTRHEPRRPRRKPGVTIAMGSESVPVGAYTRKVLDGLPAASAKRSWPTCAPTSPTSAAWSARSPRARSTPASSTSPTSRPTGGELKAIDLPGGPQAAGRVRCRRGQGRQAPRAGPASSSTGCCAGAGPRRARPRRLPAAAGHVTWFTGLLVGGAGASSLAFLVLPVVAIFVDVGPGELLAEPRRPRRDRGAVAVAADEPDGDRADPRGRDAGGVAAGDAVVHGPRARDHAGRAAAGAAARGGGDRAAGRGRPARAAGAAWASRSRSRRRRSWSR